MGENLDIIFTLMNTSLLQVTFCSSGRARTCNPLVNSQVLYQLSYRGVKRPINYNGPATIVKHSALA